MTTDKRIAALREAYLQALEFGVADLNNATEEDARAYFAAIERHEKLTSAITQGLESIYSLEQPNSQP